MRFQVKHLLIATTVVAILVYLVNQFPAVAWTIAFGGWLAAYYVAAGLIVFGATHPGRSRWIIFGGLAASFGVKLGLTHLSEPYPPLDPWRWIGELVVTVVCGLIVAGLIAAASRPRPTRRAGKAGATRAR